MSRLILSFLDVIGATNHVGDYWTDGYIRLYLKFVMEERKPCDFESKIAAVFDSLTRLRAHSTSILLELFVVFGISLGLMIDSIPTK